MPRDGKADVDDRPRKCSEIAHDGSALPRWRLMAWKAFNHKKAGQAITITLARPKTRDVGLWPLADISLFPLRRTCPLLG
jgi:hypothetical protein